METLLNQYITAHNRALTEGVSCYVIRGRRETSSDETAPEGSSDMIPPGSYVIVYDTRTHPLSVFPNSFAAEISLNKTSEAARKILHNVRDKWSEADRPLLPRRFRSPESFQRAIQLQTTVEERPGVVRIVANRPLFNKYPLWNFSASPVLTLILRVPRLHEWLVSRAEVADILCHTGETDPIVAARDWLRYIEDVEGQWPLEAIGFREAKIVTVHDLIPRAVTLIPFQPFQLTIPDITTILSEEAFYRHLGDYALHGDYALVRRQEGSPNEFLNPNDLEHAGYELMAWVTQVGLLWQRYRHESGNDVVVLVEPDSPDHWSLLVSKSDVLAEVSSSQLMLWSRKELDTCTGETDFHGSRTIVGNYLRSPSALAINAVVPFREPMSCTAIEIESVKEDDFPFIAQPKLDGNRIIVHVLGVNHPEPVVKYYSRNGILQTAKFSEQYNGDVILFAWGLSQTLSTATPINNVMLDCECYADDVIHSDISGWCNRVAISDEFRKLKLVILSWVNLDTLGTERLRGRDYVIGDMDFDTILLRNQEISRSILVAIVETGRAESPQSHQLTPEGLTIRVNDSFYITERRQLYDLMSEVTAKGAEGLVLYPPSRAYTFANAGLKKIKKFYDGECIVLGYYPSTTDPMEIGSVRVQASAWFDRWVPTARDSRNVIFAVNAALRQELKRGSMASAAFANLIGKSFTIMCASFSEDGVPIHARFKAAFGPGSERLDV